MCDSDNGTYDKCDFLEYFSIRVVLCKFGHLTGGFLKIALLNIINCLNQNHNFKNFREILLELNSKLSKEKFITLAISWWCIWNKRNQNIFQQNNNDNIKDLPTYISTIRNNWKKTKKLNEEIQPSSNKLAKKQSRKKKNITWIKPKLNNYKINFDGAVDKNGNAAMGFIIRNHLGIPVFMDHATDKHLTVLQTETLALRMAIKKLKQLNLSMVEIEGDNLCLMNVMQGSWTCPWSIDVLISDIRFDILHYHGLKFTHIFREVNQVADRIAKLGFLKNVPNWRDDLELHALIRKDALGQTISRV